jgi:group II intron reverse transcriptase/maturase
MSKLTNLAWDDISWPQVISRTRRIQRRIYKASANGEKIRVQWLQKKLINSHDGKLYSVLQVTTLNKGKHTPGMDKFIAKTPSEKMLLAERLTLDGTARPINRVWIPKPGKSEKRPLGIPTIQDRAKQALAKLALEPEWEAKFEPNSYGFRPGRSSHDAVEAIYSSLHHGTPKFVFDADIKKCFDRINHSALLSKLDTFPLLERQIQAWLEAGIMDQYSSTPNELVPTTVGTPQGGIVSPLLANIALHGLETFIKEHVHEMKFKLPSRGKIARQKSIGIVRYADDFVVMHVYKEVLEELVPLISNWLSTMGLEISEEKSSIRSITQGFVFLGFQFIQIRKGNRYKISITPSYLNQSRFLTKIREVVRNNRSASSYLLISKLRPIIIGWANYFRYCECSSTFSKMTHLVFQKIRAWVFRRDRKQGRIKIKDKYFPTGKSYSFDNTSHLDNWILTGTYKDKKGVLLENLLPHMSWVHSKKHVKVLESKSPFDGDHIYWSKRNSKYGVFSTRQQNLLERQFYKCTMCGRTFETFDQLEVDHVIPKQKGGKDEYSNLQILHRECHVNKTRNDVYH